MEKLKITLKECCLNCEDFYATGPFGLGCANSREIGCAHIPVCYKYRAEKEEKEEDEKLDICPRCLTKPEVKKSDGEFYVSCGCARSTFYRERNSAIEVWNKWAKIKSEEIIKKALPCFCCGGKAKFIKSVDSGLCWAVCESCGFIVTSNSGLKGVIELWNQRA